jgi:hypothetical protein
VAVAESLTAGPYNLDINKLAEYMKEDQVKDAGGNLIRKPVDPFLKKCVMNNHSYCIQVLLPRKFKQLPQN